MPKPAVITVPKNTSEHRKAAEDLGEDVLIYVAMLAVRKMFDSKNIKTTMVGSVVLLPEYHHNGVKILTSIGNKSYELTKEQFEWIKNAEIDVVFWTIVEPTPNRTIVTFKGFNSMIEYDLSKADRGNVWVVDLCLPMARIMDYLGDKQR